MALTTQNTAESNCYYVTRLYFRAIINNCQGELQATQSVSVLHTSSFILNTPLHLGL